MRDKFVNRTLNPLLHDLPAKFARIEPYQIPVVAEIVDAFDRGEKVVVLDAPTGSGKTLIAEVVRRMLKTDGVYVCSGKQLQNQFLADFADSRVLYGRGNYDCQGVLGTCEDGTALGCDDDRCPYARARAECFGAGCAVVNSALWVSAMHQPGNWLARRGLTVFDEADTLEGVLMGQAEIWVSERAQKRYGISPPERMTVEASYREWAEATVEILRAARKRVKPVDVGRARERRKLSRLIGNIELLLADLDRGEPWVYTGGAGSARRAGSTVSFKPVRVAGLGRERIWPNGQRFLLMSATMIAGGARLRDLGWENGFAEVRMPSQFPAKNRQVVVRPVAKMTRGEVDLGASRALLAVERILAEHDGQRVLIHTVSYRLAQMVAAGLEGCGREVVEYESSAGKEAALEKFLSQSGSVLVAPSMDRGVDLPGDACRVQIVLKTPLGNLGDRQVDARLHSGGGQVWYAMQTAASLMQMVGRAVRSTDDWAVTYVLDSHFLTWRRQWGHLLPGWFSKAVRVETYPATTTPTRSGRALPR